MKEIQEYMILSKALKTRSIFSKDEFAEEDFAKLVNEKIKEGWQPLGGVNVVNFYSDTRSDKKINQAMVKFR